MSKARAREIDRYVGVYRNPNYRMGDKRRKKATEVLLGIPAGSLLDVGAGRGEGVQIAMACGHVSFGVEPVPYLAAINVVTGVATALPFGDKSFDTVMCLDVLEHLIEKDIEPALCEMRRVARKRVFLTASERPHVVKGFGDMHISKRPILEWDALFVRMFPEARIARLGMVGVSPGWMIEV
jgi:SAM-dependent methyltransferase